MPSLVPALMPRLEANPLSSFYIGPGTFYPMYDRQSLINLPASICYWLGVPEFGAPPLADEFLTTLPAAYRRVIMLVVDGLGLQQFEQLTQPPAGRGGGRFAFWQRLMEEALLFPITSIAPSTTASALTSLWTGQAPASHGIMGYEMYLKEYGMLANMITHAPVSFTGDVGGLRRAGFQPETFLTLPTLGPHLVQNGVKPFALQHASIARSGLSTMLLPQVNVLPFRSPSDLWVTLPNHLLAHAGEKTYTYIYWGELDELSHKFGPSDRRVELEFNLFSYLLDGFINEMRKHGNGDTLFLITADHGHLETPPSLSQELRYHPEFMSQLHLNPSGENRLAYLHIKPGREQRIKDYIEGHWPGRFQLLPAEAVVQSGLFGKGHPHSRLDERVGDYILFAQDDAYLWWADKENPLLDRHGGLSRTEMLVPLLALTF